MIIKKTSYRNHDLKFRLKKPRKDKNGRTESPEQQKKTHSTLIDL